MAVEWYYMFEDEECGPVDARALKELAAQRTVAEGSLVRRGSVGPWVSASRVRGLFPNRRVEDTGSSTPGGNGGLSPGATSALEAASSPECDVPVFTDIGEQNAESHGQRAIVPNADKRRGSDQDVPPVPKATAKGASSFVSTKLKLSPGLAMAMLGASAGVIAMLVIWAAISLLGGGSGDESEVAKAQQANRSVRETVPPPPPPPVNREDATLAPVEQIEPPAPAEEADVAISPPDNDSAIDSPSVASKVGPAVVTLEVPGGGMGSGFLVDDDTTIITNYHVIEGAKEIIVRFRDGHSCAVLGFLAIAPGKDLALLRIVDSDREITPLEVQAKPPAKGETVLAFGAPIGLKGSVSDGIVSAVRPGDEVREQLSRSQGFDVYIDQMQYDVETTWIQTSAPISHGNSGGPLVDTRGKVVGVNTWYQVKGQNLNFAVASRHIVDLLYNATDDARSLAELPEPRVSPLERAELARKRHAEEERRLAEERVAEKSRQEKQERQDELDRIERVGKTQQELARLNQRMITVKNELRTIESEGTALTVRQTAIVAEGRRASTQIAQLAPRVRNLQAKIGQLTWAIDNRVINGVSYLRGHEAEFAEMRFQRDQLKLQLAPLQQEGTQLQSHLAGLQTAAMGITQQIQYKAAERERLTADLQELERRYGELRDGDPLEVDGTDVNGDPTGDKRLPM